MGVSLNLLKGSVVTFTPYQLSAMKYVKKGWSPIPMTGANAAGAKGQPLAGWTGRDGAIVDAQNAEQLMFGAGATTHPDVSVRAYGWVGIDVDNNYGDKCGAAQLEEAEELYGKLPDTYYSTARGAESGSRILVFRIPLEAHIHPEGYSFEALLDDPADGAIEIIRFDHRYIKCWPTVHPNGELYRWYHQQSGGDFLLPEGEIPAVHNLPRLPEAWLTFLTTDNRESRPSRKAVARDGVPLDPEDHVFPELADVTHFLKAHRQACLDRPQGSGFNGALNQYAHALSAFVPGFYTEEEATELLYEVCRHHWDRPNAADRATIRSGLIKSRQPFYARRPTQDEKNDVFSPWCTIKPEPPRERRAHVPKPVAAWLIPPVVSEDASPEEDVYVTGRVCDETGRVEGELLDELFSDPAFPMFGHVRQFARARGVSPIATLGVVLVRISTALPVYMVTPPFIGKHGSLNSFLCLVGRAGMSKGGATGAAEDAVQITMEHSAHGVRQYDGPLWSPKIGSGQGVAAQFCHRRKPDPKTGDPGELIRDRDAVLFTCQEVSDMTAKSGGTSTLLSTICEMWVAEPLGSSYVDPTKRLPVAGMSYRACFMLHAQPDLLGPLLIDSAPSGAPQRFLYLPVVDQFRPDNEPVAPEPLAWSPPSVSRLAGRAEIPVCRRAERAIKNHNRRMHDGLSDPLDGHALFARLKTAVAINASRGLISVDDAAWDHAGRIHDLGKQTRTEVINYLHTQKKAANRIAAEVEGHKELIKSEIVLAEVVDKGRARAIEVLASAPVYTLTKRDVQLRCSRKWDPEAWDKLCTEGVVSWKSVEFAGENRKATKTVYALAGVL